MAPASFDLGRFRASLRTTTFGRTLIFEPSVGSTMDLARDAAAHGSPEGTVALADEQTAGRGRLGRAWITPPAANLATTVLLRPALRLMRQVAMIAPLAVCDAIEDVTRIRADIKWPNDVQIRGRKVAGILIESDISDSAIAVVLVGTGINVNFDPGQFDEIAMTATSLMAETGGEVERERLLASYLLCFERIYERATAGASAHARWRERLVTLGRRVHASWPGGEVDGVAEDVDGEGGLIVRGDSGAAVTVEAGDVTLRA